MMGGLLSLARARGGKADTGDDEPVLMCQHLSISASLLSLFKLPTSQPDALSAFDIDAIPVRAGRGRHLQAAERRSAVCRGTSTHGIPQGVVHSRVSGDNLVR